MATFAFADKPRVPLSVRIISYKYDAWLPGSLGGVAMQSVMPVIRDRRVKAIGIAAAKRSPAAPDIPTMAESGLPGFEVASWYGLLAPAGTPREIITRLHAEVVKAVASPEVRERFQSFGAEPVGSSPEEFATQIKSDIAKWAKVAKAANVRAD